MPLILEKLQCLNLPSDVASHSSRRFRWAGGKGFAWVMMMSLVTLTFGGAATAEALSSGKGKIRILKTEKFVGSEEVCVIGKLVAGAVTKKMNLCGKDCAQVVSVESKYGDGFCSKQGAQVVLMVSGVDKSEFNMGTEIEFQKGATEEAAKPKGRIIIA